MTLAAAVAGVMAVLTLAGCSSGSNDAAPPEVTSTTSAGSFALAAAQEACRLGDTSSGQTNTNITRRALELRGESVSGMTDEAVNRRWVQLASQPGSGSDDLSRRAAVEIYGMATEAAARAAALDPRWEQLHRGLSDYRAYWANRSNPSQAQTRQWFEDIRLGCERAEALGGP